MELVSGKHDKLGHDKLKWGKNHLCIVLRGKMNGTAIAKWKYINIFNFLKILWKMISKFFFFTDYACEAGT